MPLVPMEAVLAGCPVVASAIAPHQELLGDVPGSLMPIDSKRWAPFLATLFEGTSRLRQLAQAQSFKAPQYSFQRMWSQYLAAYQQLIQRRSNHQR